MNMEIRDQGAIETITVQFDSEEQKEAFNNRLFELIQNFAEESNAKLVNPIGEDVNELHDTTPEDLCQQFISKYAIKKEYTADDFTEFNHFIGR